MALTFERFNADTSLNEQRALFSSCFPENKGLSIEGSEHYRWKFHSFPNEKPSYEYIARDQDSKAMLGYYAAIPFRYSVAGTDLQCGMVCDVMTSPAARGQGVFTKLGRYSTDSLRECELDFTSGYPIRAEVIPGHLKVGWQIAFELPMYLKILTVSSILSRYKLQVLAPLANLALSPLRILTRGSKAGYRTESYNAAAFFTEHEHAYVQFFKRWSAEQTIFLHKDIPFLRWRTSAPETSYSVIAVWNGEEIVGISLVRATELKGISTLAILDFMVISSAADAVGALHAAIEHAARDANRDTVCVMASRTTAKRLAFLRHGFFATPFVFKLIIKTLSAKARNDILLSEANWNLLWVDSDDL